MKLRMEIQKIVSHDSYNSYSDEESPDTKEVVRIRKSKKNRQHSGQTKQTEMDKQRSTKHGIELRCSGRVSSSSQHVS